jgi:hypothetical protein
VTSFIFASMAPTRASFTRPVEPRVLGAVAPHGNILGLRLEATLAVDDESLN